MRKQKKGTTKWKVRQVRKKGNIKEKQGKLDIKTGIKVRNKTAVRNGNGEEMAIT